MLPKNVTAVTVGIAAVLLGALHTPPFAVPTSPPPPVVSVPQAPDAGTPATSQTVPANPIGTQPAQKAPEQPASQTPDYPVRLIIPSISLSDPIQNVGLTPDGAMDVPSGTTHNIGWYDEGTVPGQMGSAVLDAHVFAAFAKLRDVPVGSDVYVVTTSGKTLHFVVEERDTYALADVPLQKLFNQSDQPRLNLITCAGTLTPDKSTYDHRLVLYATLVS